MQKFGQREFVDIIKRLHRLGLMVRIEKFRKNMAPRSSLYHLSTFFEDSIKNLDGEGIAFILSKDKKGKVKLEMFNMRVGKILSSIWRLSYRCVFCSGTLNPVDEFAKVIGLENYVGKSFPSIFNEKCAHNYNIISHHKR